MIEFKAGDLADGDERNNIMSFEQVSAIALAMSDYVIELMHAA